MLSLRKALSAGLRHSQQTCFRNMKCILHAPFLDIGTLPVRSAKFACASVFSGPQSTAASSAGAFAREQASYVQGACTQPLLGETIACNLAKTVQQYPNKLAVSSFHQKVRHLCTRLQTTLICSCDHSHLLQKCLSYSEFHQAVEQVARGLLGIGIRPGEPARYCCADLRASFARSGCIPKCMLCLHQMVAGWQALRRLGHDLT